MNAKGITPILNVTDLAASFEWFAKAGWVKCWDWQDPGDDSASFGAVGSGECEIFLCREAQGGRGTWMTVWVEDVDAIHEACVRQGLEVLCPPVDEPWGVREFHLRHPDGHVFRISKGIGATTDL